MTPRKLRFVVAASVVVAAFLSSYSFAAARVGSRGAGAGSPAASAGPASAASTSPSTGTGGAGCACCSGGPATTVEGAATRDGGVQRVSIDASGGQFAPNKIRLAAGVPAVLTFSQGAGCLAQVVFKDMGITRDLTSGGAVVELPALEPGTYTFSCGMEMVFGTLVVE